MSHGDTCIGWRSLGAKEVGGEKQSVGHCLRMNTYSDLG